LIKNTLPNGQHFIRGRAYGQAMEGIFMLQPALKCDTTIATSFILKPVKSLPGIQA
jgi:hypothetical protein